MAKLRFARSSLRWGFRSSMPSYAFVLHDHMGRTLCLYVTHALPSHMHLNPYSYDHIHMHTYAFRHLFFFFRSFVWGVRDVCLYPVGHTFYMTI